RIRYDWTGLPGMPTWGSMEPKTSAISASILRFIGRSVAPALTAFAAGLTHWRGAIEADFSLSRRASVTNCRSDMPCFAALDFARRKMLSGISSVVFIARWSDILGARVKGLMSWEATEK